MNLHCEWSFCNECFYSWDKFNTHLVDHASLESGTKINNIFCDFFKYIFLENLKCQWQNCDATCVSMCFLMQHISYHGYLSKLKSIGQNVLDRNDWPACNLKENYRMPILPEGYTCRWEYCSFNFCMIYEFYSHMEVHVQNNPRVSNDSTNDIILCCWEGKNY